MWVIMNYSSEFTKSWRHVGLCNNEFNITTPNLNQITQGVSAWNDRINE